MNCGVFIPICPPTLWGAAKYGPWASAWMNCSGFPPPWGAREGTFPSWEVPLRGSEVGQSTPGPSGSEAAPLISTSLAPPLSFGHIQLGWPLGERTVPRWGGRGQAPCWVVIGHGETGGLSPSWAQTGCVRLAPWPGPLLCLPGSHRPSAWGGEKNAELELRVRLGVCACVMWLFRV